MYGTIRCTRSASTLAAVGTTLTNPDFAAFAASFGAYGERVERTESSRPRSSGHSPTVARRCSTSASTRGDHSSHNAYGGAEGKAGRERTETV